MRLLPVRLWLVCFALVPALVARAQFDTLNDPGRTDADVSVKVMRPAYAPGEKGMAAIVIDVPAHLHAQSSKPLDPDAIAFVVTAGPVKGVVLDGIDYADGEIVELPVVGKVSVYEGRFVTYVAFTVAADAAEGELTLPMSALYQTCDDKNQCFPPVKAPAAVTIKVSKTAPPAVPVDDVFKDEKRLVRLASQTPPVVAPPAATQPAEATPATPPTASHAVASTPHPAASEIKTLPVALGFALLAGLIFNVMPCVLPVLPLKIAGFYEAAQHDRGRTTLFGVAFSFGVLAVFFVLATLVLLSRTLFGFDFNWGQQFSNPWFVWPLVGVLAALGLGMFGMFNVNLPSSVYGLNFRHDTMSGNFMWGGLTAVLSTPCTAFFFPAVLGFVLLQPVWIGYLVLLTVGAGMALPYLILSAFPDVARNMPRTGPISELIKQTLAFCLLGTAAFFAGVRLGGDDAWWFVVPVALWGGLFIVVRGMQLFKSSGAMMATTALATTAIVASVCTALWMSGTFDPPVQVARARPDDDKLGPRHGLWYAYSPATYAAARASGRPVLLKFTASWCLNCKAIERTVYVDPAVQSALLEHDVITMKVDMTVDNPDAKKLLVSLGNTGIPFTAVFPAGGDVPETLASIYTSAELLDLLARQPAAVATR